MKRFYAAVAVEEFAGGWRVTLDGRPVRTAGGKPQVVPTAALAEAMTLEWSSQGEEIKPASLVFRDMADYAIDVVAPDPAAAIAALLPYGETDTLCYRADLGDALADRQDELWEPLVQAAEGRWDIHFERVTGIIHRAQPKPTLARMRAVLAAYDPFTLAALRTLAGLAASLVIGLAALEPGADIAALWDAANLEEDWQAQLWGQDDEALELREKRKAAFTSGAHFARLVR